MFKNLIKIKFDKKNSLIFKFFSIVILHFNDQIDMNQIRSEFGFKMFTD